MRKKKIQSQMINGKMPFERSVINCYIEKHFKVEDLENIYEGNIVTFENKRDQIRFLSELLSNKTKIENSETYKFGLPEHLLKTTEYDVKLNKFKNLMVNNKLDIDGTIAKNRAIYIHSHKLYNFFPDDPSNHIFMSGFSEKFLPKLSIGKLEGRENISVMNFMNRARKAFSDLGMVSNRKKMQILDSDNEVNF